MSTAETLDRKSLTLAARVTAYEDGYQARYDGTIRENYPDGMSDGEIDAWHDGWDHCADGYGCFPPEE